MSLLVNSTNGPATPECSIHKDFDKDSKGLAVIERLLQECNPDDLIIGIDEAGRGPVLGPMVFGAAFCRMSDYQKVTDLGVKDSKKLSEAERNELRSKIVQSDFCQAITVALHPKLISGWMLKRSGSYNLNTMSHDTAILLVDSIMTYALAFSKQKGSTASAAVPPTLELESWNLRNSPVARTPVEGFTSWKSDRPVGKVRVIVADTVGPPERHRTILSSRFPWAHVYVLPKADDYWSIVSAASIMAKTKRDELVAHWAFEEVGGLLHLSKEFGTGYPGEPLTKKWLKRSFTKVFGFPNFVRMSWGTSKEILESNAIPVSFEEPPSAEAVEAGQDLRQLFRKRRGQYFEELELQNVDKV